MAINLFDTRTLLDAVKLMKPVKTFLRDTFFGATQTFLTTAVDIDLVKGKRKLAPFVSPRIGSTTIETLGFSTTTYKVPQVGMDYPFTGEDLQQRLPGENIYSVQDPSSRLATLIGNKLAEFDDYITRREEWMCAQALFTGQIPIEGEGVSQTIDFQVPDANKITISAAKSKWSYTGTDYTGDPIQNLKDWRLQLIKATGINPTHIVMASDAADAFMKHPAVIERLKLYNATYGTFNPSKIEVNGTRYICHLNEIGLDLYSYDEWFIDPADDTEKSMVPNGKVLMASNQAQFKILYGAIIDLYSGIFAMTRVPKSWVEEKPGIRYLQLAAKPLPVPTIVDSFIVASVL